LTGDTQRRIKERIRGFDAVALLRLLAELGVHPLQIRYRGHRASGPQPTLLHDIDFQPGGLIVITVTLGLSSCRSPLPAYLVAALADPGAGEALGKLLDFLDDRLVGERLASFRPELDPRFIPRWGKTRLDMLRLTTRTSPSRLHWMFQRIYPELGVTVRRVAGRRRMEVPDVRLGSGQMGIAAFGGEARVPISGLEVTLLCDEATTYTGDPWTVEADRRLTEHVFPLLGETGVYLTVALVFFDRVAPSRFDDRSHVSYNPLPGGPARPGRVVLFTGPIPVATGPAPAGKYRR
jgi:hypothetical protein